MSKAIVVSDESSLGLLSLEHLKKHSKSYDKVLLVEPPAGNVYAAKSLVSHSARKVISVPLHHSKITDYVERADVVFVYWDRKDENVRAMLDRSIQLKKPSYLFTPMGTMEFHLENHFPG